MRDVDELFAHLRQSPFRARQTLNDKDRRYLTTQGLDAILVHAAEFIEKRLAPREPRNDGKQTPWRGHPVFTAQHASVEPLALPGLSLRPLDIEQMKVRFDLEVHVGDTPEGLLTAFYFNTDVFDHDTIERMSAAFGALLQGVAAEPDRAVADLELMPAAEVRMLREWNATTRPMPSGPMLHEIFEAQAARTPQISALEYNGSAVS